MQKVKIPVWVVVFDTRQGHFIETHAEEPAAINSIVEAVQQWAVDWGMKSKVTAENWKSILSHLHERGGQDYVHFEGPGVEVPVETLKAAISAHEAAAR